MSTIETVKPMDIIHSRYKILETLGQGGVGTTYKAEDLHTQQYVALKVVSLRQTSDWKTLDLFEREVKVLKQLNHPAIPRYIDSFEIDTQDDRLFCIVQALAPGKTLAQWIQKGWRPDEDTTKAIAFQLLDILVYLQTFLPPILHRDIKPQNILRDREGNIYLVDFGAVQDTYRQTVAGGSTVVGTLGYMAPEQFRGKATCATDLYALGTTLLYLLTGKDPNQLQTSDDLQLQIPPNLRISAEFSRWLKRCIEAAEEDRFNSAALALSALQGRNPKEEFVSSPSPQRPRNTKVSLIKSDRALHIHFSGQSFQSSKADKIRIRIGLVLLYLLTAFILFRIVAVSRLNMSEVGYYGLILVTFPCVTALAGICFARDLQTLIKPTVLSVNDYTLILAGMLKRFEFYQKISFILEDIEDIHLEKTRKGESVGVIRMRTQEVYQFGQYLSPTEQRWLVHELQTFIQAAKQRAKERFEQIQDSRLTTLDALFQRAIRCYQSDQLAQAETLFHAILIFDAASAEAYNNLGVIQHRLNQHSKSADFFQKALQIAPSYWAARTNFAIALQEDNFTQAIAMYGTPCPSDQTTGNDRYTLILYNQWRGSLADAIAEFETPPPDEALLAIKNHCRHADLLQCKGDFTTAIDLYRHVLKLAKHNPALSAEIYAELAWTFAMMHNLKEAQACLARSRKLAPTTEHGTTRYTEALMQYLKPNRG